MTEPNEPSTPLSRMRFSWQRNTGRPATTGGEPAPASQPALGGEAAESTPYPESRTEPHPAAEPYDQYRSEPHPATEPYDQYRADDSPTSGSMTYAGREVVLDDVPAYWDDEAGPPPAAPPTRGPTARRDPPARRDAGWRDAGPPRTRPATRRGVDERATDAAPRARRTTSAPTALTTGRSRGNRGADRNGARPSATRGRLRDTGGTFDVPPPGGRFSGGRGSHTAVKVTLVLCACFVATGIVAYLAFSLGASIASANRYRLSEDDIARYRLTNFPLEQAGRFAADYARICLTHDSGTPGAAEQREAQLARYVSAGTDATCGWNGEGTQSVIDASWTGESEPIRLEGYAGRARMMTVRVLTSTGSRVVSVPVYVADLESGDGMRIIGDIGEMPQPTLAAAPEPQPPAETDGDLADALVQGEFFQQFFTAWGESNRPALQRFMTPDATTRAATGLGGSVTEPTIREARVFLPKGVDAAEDYEWRTGMVTEAWVWVNWRNPGAGESAVETRAYRIQLVKTTQASSPSQEWAVRDIRGGVPDLRGG